MSGNASVLIMDNLKASRFQKIKYASVQHKRRTVRAELGSCVCLPREDNPRRNKGLIQDYWQCQHACVPIPLYLRAQTLVPQTRLDKAHQDLLVISRFINYIDNSEQISSLSGRFAVLCTRPRCEVSIKEGAIVSLSSHKAHNEAEAPPVF